MNKRTNEDMYNINKYTDSELFQVLDLVNPSDRELEAKIIYFLKKYESIKNESGKQLYNFFNDIYNHFFETSDDDDDENFTGNVKAASDRSESRQYVLNGTAGVDNSINYGNANIAYDTNVNLSGNIFGIDDDNKIFGNAIVAKTIDRNSDYRKDDVKLTKTLDYAKDNLNPLLKQTVRRIISIDSSYRPNNKDLATDFTFNLSDPLKDVLSLKLYSVQIPYTWYTISKQYGSNFFYLKGNSPGIDNGDHDYQIKINAGNYTPSNLIDAINSSIKDVASTYTDASFGTTAVNYNSFTSASTVTVDITKIYNETRYYLYFPTWTTPNDTIVRKETIPGFLGYNDTSYNISTIYSTRTLPLTSTTGNSDGTTNTNTDNTSGVYSITSSNRYFTIRQYDGNDEYNSTTSNVLFTFDISFNSSNILNGSVYTRNALFDDLSGVLFSNPYLSNSYIQRIDVTDPSLNGFGNSYYKMNIQLNQKTTINKKNSKTVVIFSEETGSNTIWTGSTSCFHFDASNVELNNIVSETSTSQTNYTISNTPRMYLKCIHSQYGYDSSNVTTRIDFSGNDYQFDISNSSVTGYTLDEYITALNDSITYVNNSTKNTINTAGDFNITNTNIISDSDNDSKIRFRFDLNKNFTENNYIIDLSGSDLRNVFDLSFSSVDMSGNNVFTSTFSDSSSYTINSTYLATIYPNIDGNYGNKYADFYFVTPRYSTKNYNLLSDVKTDINYAFTNYADSDGDNVLSGSSINFTQISTSKYACTLTIKVTKSLTQNDYLLEFYDPSSNTTWTKDSTNSWYNYLNIADQSYNLVDYLVSNKPYSDVYGSSAVFGNTITLSNNSNNYFYLKPLSTSNGIYSGSDANDILFTIDAGEYTRTQLINKINAAFANNSLTVGSSISIYTNESVDYSKLRLNVNKVFTANDYRLVFYDPYSFIKCYIGSSSVKNTTWDATLGWILGFRDLTEYTLTKGSEQIDPNDDTVIYYEGTGSFYSSNSNTNIVNITSDTAVSTNLYNYFLIVLDDFNQSHLNDGLVTITNAETDIPLPSYANRSIIECNPLTGETVFTGTTNTMGNNLTQKAVYATNEKLNSRRNKAKSYSNGPFVKDIFGLIPMKTAGLANGSTYIEFGGTLQNQDRTYFGPVNIHRMGIKLMNERGDVVDLNGSNWSFSLMCEQLYKGNT
jgi:mRNA-degrading endonuclease HigB of HigAB toxin-antitoxin module